jgi:glycosyltransferase involved in cell wall biosynthesis
MSERRPHVLQMGPDPSIGGGMAAVLRELLASPLADAYRLDLDPTYRSATPLRRVVTFAGSLARLVAWSARGRSHRVVHIHATVRGSAYRKSICVLVAKALGRKVVLQFHSGAGDIDTFAARLRRPVMATFRFAFARADVALAVSDASAAALRRTYGPEAIEVVPNPAPAVEPPIGPRGDEAPQVLLYLGGFANSAKGGDVLLDALALLPGELGVEVILAGPGEPDAAGEALIAADPRTSWVGWLDPAEKDTLLRRATAFVIPSRSEGLPMALLEAMAYDLPVVATAVGGMPEVVEDGVEALLVEPEPGAIAAALERLLGDSALRRRLALAAGAHARALGPPVIAARLAGIYEEALRR